MPKPVVSFDRPYVIRVADKLTIVAEADDAEALKNVPRCIMMEGTAYEALTATGDLREIEKNLRDAIEMELGVESEVTIFIEGFDESERWIRTIKVED